MWIDSDSLSFSLSLYSLFCAGFCDVIGSSTWKTWLVGRQLEGGKNHARAQDYRMSHNEKSTTKHNKIKQIVSIGYGKTRSRDFQESFLYFHYEKWSEIKYSRVA